MEVRCHKIDYSSNAVRGFVCSHNADLYSLVKNSNLMHILNSSFTLTHFNASVAQSFNKVRQGSAFYIKPKLKTQLHKCKIPSVSPV